MKFSIDAGNFAKAIATASKFASKSQSIPLLQNIHIETDQNGIVVSARDMTIGGRFRLDAEVEEHGEICLSSGTLGRYLAIQLSGKLSFKTDARNWAFLECGKAKSKMAGTAGASFPRFAETPEVSTETTCWLLGSLIEKASSGSTNSSMDSNSRGGYPNSVYITGEDEFLEVIGSDGHRASFARSEQLVSMGGFLLSQACWSTLLKYCKDQSSDEPLRIAFDDHAVWFSTEADELSFSRLSSNFPLASIRKIVNAHCSTMQSSCIVPIADFKPAFDRARSAQSGSEVESVQLAFATGIVTVSSAKFDACEVEEIVLASCTSERTIVLNAEYLGRAITASESETIKMEWGENKDCIRFTGNGQKDAGWYVLIYLIDRDKASKPAEQPKPKVRKGKDQETA